MTLRVLTDLAAEKSVELQGFKQEADGAYLIESVTHHLARQSWTTSVELAAGKSGKARAGHAHQAARPKERTGYPYCMLIHRTCHPTLVWGFLFLEISINTPMTPTTRESWVSMPLDEFERLVEDAAERGAKHAMTDVGRDGENAAANIHGLRGLLEAYNTAKHTAWQPLIRMVTTGFILALVASVLIKLTLFGGGY